MMDRSGEHGQRPALENSNILRYHTHWLLPEKAIVSVYYLLKFLLAAFVSCSRLFLPMLSTRKTFRSQYMTRLWSAKFKLIPSFLAEGGGGGWGLSHFPPKFKNIFVVVLTFPPFFCANNYYTTLLLIVCALRWYVKSLYRHFFLEDIAIHARVTQKMAPPNFPGF